MPINFETVKTNLYNWASSQAGMGIPVIFLEENAPRPTTPYITLKIGAILQIGWDYIFDPTTNLGSNNQVGDREFTLYIQAYGGDPITLLENLRTSLQKESVLDSLRASNLAVIGQFAIEDVSAIIESRFENRASLDIRFRIAQVYTDSIGVIDTVELQEKVEDAIGTVIFNETILIPNP